MANERLISILISVCPYPIPESWLTELRSYPEIPEFVYESIASLGIPQGYWGKLKVARGFQKFMKRYHKWKKENKIITKEHDLLREAKEAEMIGPTI